MASSAALVVCRLRLHFSHFGLSASLPANAHYSECDLVSLIEINFPLDRMAFLRCTISVPLCSDTVLTACDLIDQQHTIVVASLSFFQPFESQSAIKVQSVPRNRCRAHAQSGACMGPERADE